MRSRAEIARYMQALQDEQNRSLQRLQDAIISGNIKTAMTAMSEADGLGCKINMLKWVLMTKPKGD